MNTSIWHKILLSFLSTILLWFSGSCKSTVSNDTTESSSDDTIESGIMEDSYTTYHLATYFTPDGTKSSTPVMVVNQNGKCVQYDNDADYSELAGICQLMHWVEFEYNWDARSNKNKVSETELYSQLPEAIETYIESGGDVNKNAYINKLIERAVYNYGFWDWNPHLSSRSYNQSVYNVHYNKRIQQMITKRAQCLTEEWGKIVLQNGDTVPEGALYFHL